jgi:RimJ/RimL family protein N-acetyltransferase
LSLTPVIETERLRLRGHTMDDFEPLVALWADPDVTRFIGGKPSSREDSWARIIRYPGMWSMLGYGFWAIEEKASGRYIGDGGFADFKRDVEPAIDAPEQGWALSPSVHGKGYATEAISAMIAWGEKKFARTDFIAMISPENAPSIRVAEKHGYREYASTTYKGSPSLLFRRA